MIKTLTSWRGIFALCIVCFHFGMHEFDQMTFAGVTFFFMLSGYLVTFRNSNVAAVKQFYSRRLLRIFPLHWLVLAAMIAVDLFLMHKFHYGWDLPLHVALLQSWIPNVDVIYNYSIHSWFLSSLVFCVIATPLLIKFLDNVSRKVAWGVIIVACVAVAVINVNANEHWHSYLYVFPATRLVDYALGMLLGTTMRERATTRHASIMRATIHELVPLAVLAVFIAIHASGNSVAQQLEHSVLWWLPVSLLLMESTALNGQEGLIGKFLSLRPLVWLGEISFEIYILQKLVNNLFCYAVAPFFGHFGILIYDYSFACTIPMLIFTAWIVSRLLSRTIAKRLKKNQ